MKFTHIFIFLLFLFLSSSFVFASDTWWDTNWTYRQALTMQTSKIGLAANVTNDYAILVDINSTNTNFWKNIQPKYGYNGTNGIWATLDANLTNYWKFDEVDGNLIDYKGFDNNGINTSIAAYSQPGIIKAAYSYNATSSKTTLQNATGLYGAEQTFSFWVNPGATGTDREIFYFAQLAPNTTEVRGIIKNTNLFNINWYNASTYQAQLNCGTLTAGKWYYIVTTAKANEFKCYVNGILVDADGSGSVNSSVAYNTNQIGFCEATGVYANSVIDEFATFNKVLSADEVTSLYKSYIGGSDVRFVNKDNNVNYSWHYEDMNFDTNKLLAWVAVTDTFPSATDLNLYIYYGNPTASSDQNTIATYSTVSNIVSDWHMKETTGTNISDATGYANATATGSPTLAQPGQIGNSIKFFTGAYLNAGTGSNFIRAYNQPWMNCVWVYPYVVTGWSGFWSVNGPQLSYDTEINNGQIGGYECKVGTGCLGYNSAAIDVNQWTYVCASFDGSANPGGIKTWINGVNVGSAQYTYGSLTSPTGPFYIGAAWTPSTDNFPGRLDEMSWWTTALAADDVKILYNSSRDLNFISFGAETHVPIKLDFNVYAAGTTTHLSAVDYDCNINALDLNNQTSPFSSTSTYGTVASCNFNKSGYDSNTQIVVYDTNKTTVVTLKLITPPVTTTNANGNWNTNAYVTFTCTPDSGQTCRDLNYSLNGGAWVDTNYNLKVLDQNQTDYSSAVWNIGVDGQLIHYTQLFMPTKARLSAIQLYFSKVGTPNNRITTNIVKTSGGNPTTISLGSTYFDSATTSSGFITLNIGIDLNVGELYGIQVDSNTYSYDNVVVIQGVAGHPYTYDCKYYNGYVSGWNSCDNTNQFYFKTYYDGNAQPISITVPDGNNLIQFKSTDNNGNTESIKTAYQATDTTTPTVTISGNTFATWTNTDQTITLTPSAPISGVKLTQYSLDGGAWTTYAGPFVISTDLNHTIDFNTMNDANTTSGIQTSWAAIDKTAPTVGPIYNALTWFNSVFSVIVSNVNYLISGKLWAKVSIDNQNFNDINSINIPSFGLQTQSGVFNGGFEYGTGSTATADTWVGDKNYGVYAKYTSGSIDFNKTYYHSGTQSIRINLTVGQYQEAWFNSTAYNSPTTAMNPLKPDTNYKMSAWVKTINVTGSSNHTPNVTGYIGTPTAYSRAVGITWADGNYDWTYGEVTFTTGTSETNIAPMFNIYGHTGAGTKAGQFYIDDFKIEEIDSINLSSQQQGRPSLTITGVTDINTIDQSQTVKDDAQTVGNYGTTQYIQAQSFVPAQTKLTGINFFNYGATTALGNLVVSIRTDNANKPSTTILASTTITPAQWNVYAGTDMPIDLPAILIPGTKYWIVFKDSNTAESGNRRYIIYTNTAGGYASGNVSQSTDNEVSWSATGEDMYFKTRFAKLSSSIDVNVVAPDGTSELKSYDVNGEILTDANITINPNGTGRYYSKFATNPSLMNDLTQISCGTTFGCTSALNSFSGYKDFNQKITLPNGCLTDGNIKITYRGVPIVSIDTNVYYSTNGTSYTLLDSQITGDTGVMDKNFSVGSVNTFWLRKNNGYAHGEYLLNWDLNFAMACSGMTTPLFKNGTNTIYTMNRDYNSTDLTNNLTPNLMSNLAFAFNDNLYIPITTDGNHDINVWIRDNAGNDTNLHTYGALDQNKPTYSYIDGNGVNKNIDFNVTVHDVNYMPSGKMFAKYSINSGAFTDTVTADANEFALVTLDGNTSVRFWLRDNAGNDTNIQVYAQLGKVAPRYSYVDGNGLPWKNYVFNVTVVDANFGVYGKNFARYQIDSNTGSWSTMSVNDGNLFVVINHDANHAVYIWLQDNNGRDTNLLVYALSDLNGPVIIRDANFGLPWRTADFNIRIDVNFAPSGKALAKYSVDGGTFNDWNFTINDINFLSTITSDGNHTIRGWFRDNAGNDTNTIGQAYLDKSGPIVGVTTLGTGFNVVGTQIWAVLGNGTVVGGTASDPNSDINTLSCEYTINNGATWLPAVWNTNHCEATGVATTPGTTPQYNTRVRDKVGNLGTGTATVVYTVDNVKPVTTDNTDTAWHGGSVTVTLSPTDAVSGVASTTYCVDDSNVCVPSLAYTVPISVTCPTNGVCGRYIRYYSTDIAGNIEDTKGSNKIKIDQNRPGVALTTLTGYNIYTTFINNNGTIVGGVATDYNGSGLNTATCEYTVNNGGAWAAGAWNTDHCEKTTAVAIVDGTSYQFNTRIADNVSNVGTGSATIAYTGDTIAPVTTPSGNTYATWTTVPQTITLTCVDARSGCNSIQYMVDSNGTWFTLNSAGPFTFILGSDGNHWIDYNSRDNVTNVETTKRTWAAIDLSAPTVGQTYIETSKILGVQIWGPVHLDAVVSDVNGVISFCQYTINNGASWLAADLNATHCYKDGITVTAGTFPQYNLRATNLAGLTGAGTATIVYTADNVAPTVGLTTATFTSTYGTGPYYIKGTGTIVGGTATDAVSGIDNTTCEYRDTNTGTWAAGTWNVNHCEKVGWNLGVNGLSYYFNTRVRDQANNLGTGAPSIRYTFDTNGPQVTYTYAQLVPGNPDVNVRLFCLDANSGCKYIWYNVDNTGWNRANTPSADFNWFVVSGAGGHRVQYLGTDNLDNNSADLNLDLNVAGRLRLRIADENTGLWMSNTTITFDSVNYTAVNGVQFDINLLGMTPGLKTITYSKALYGTRYYDIYMTPDRDYDVNMLMLDSTKGAIIPFTFYMNDATTVAANGFADLNRPDRDHFSIGRESLNASGGASFFINNRDQNYTQTITTSTGDINYSFPVYVTVLFPLDELTLLPIDNNWNLLVITNTVYSKSDINLFGGDYPTVPGDANVYLMPNTGNTTIVQISDINSVYFPRLYGLSFPGNPLSYTLQPYLVQYLQGNNTTFITTNQLGFAIPGITIEIYKTINNITTLVASGVTDSSGSFTSSLGVTQNYSFKLYINGVLISPSLFTLQIVENKYYFTINTFGYPVDTNTISPIQVIWDPSNEYLFGTTVLTQRISGNTANFVKVITYQYTDANNTGRSNKYVEWYACPQSCTINQLLANMIGNGGLDGNLELYIDVNVYYDSNAHMQTFTKNYRLPSLNIDFMQSFVNAKADFGCQPTVGSLCPWTSILAVVLSIIAMGAVMYSIKIFNPFAMALIGGIVLGFFTLVGWFFWMLLIPLGLVLIFGLFGRRGSE